MSLPQPPTELLAPAGDWEALRAAVANGADAVYFGVQGFNARHRAANFTLEELPQLCDYLQRHNVRGYVTLNTLIFPEELDQVAQVVAAISQAGADAVIVQDLGLVRLIRRLAPDLPVHASTQMTLTEPLGLAAVQELGVARAILARELSLDEIVRIREQCDLPLEVFVHGALCVAYSGQCLTSEALGGRSANRGQCAQACRLPYELLVDGQPRELGDVAYLLSPQDLAAHDLTPDLVRAGVACLKIEGRLKAAPYVAAATQVYRRALDAALAGGDFAASPAERRDLRQTFSRGFAPGFLEGADHQRLVQGRFPKSRGVPVGQVVGTTRRGVLVELTPDCAVKYLQPGDGVLFDQGRPETDEPGGRLIGVRLVGPGTPQRVELQLDPRRTDWSQVAAGNLVWKTDDPRLRERLQATYARDAVARRIPLHWRVEGRLGGPLCLTGRTADGRTAVAQWDGPMQAGQKRSWTADEIRSCLTRLGDTPFECGDVACELPSGLFVPKSELNSLRRDVVARLLQRTPRVLHETALAELQAEDRAQLADSPVATDSPTLHVMARTLAQFAAAVRWRPGVEGVAAGLVYADFEDLRNYAQAVALARDAARGVGLAGLRVQKPGEEGHLRLIARQEADAVLVRNLATHRLLRTAAPHLRQVGDYALNVANELTAAWWLQQGLARVTPSHDLNWEQLAALCERVRTDRLEVVVQHHMPMFHMEHCVYAALLSEGKDWRDCGRPCETHRVELRDRVGATFPVSVDTGCRNTVYNAWPQSAAEYVPRMLRLGVRHFRVELLQEGPSEVAALLDRYARVLGGLDDGRAAWRGLRVLQQLGLTRGTLQQV